MFCCYYVIENPIRISPLFIIQLGEEDISVSSPLTHYCKFLNRIWFGNYPLKRPPERLEVLWNKEFNLQLAKPKHTQRIVDKQCKQTKYGVDKKTKTKIFCPSWPGEILFTFIPIHTHAVGLFIDNPYSRMLGPT